MSRLFPTYAYRPAILNWRIHFLTQLCTRDQPHLPSFGTERTHHTHYCTAQDACNSNVTVEIMPSLLLLASRCQAYLRAQPRRVGIAWKMRINVEWELQGRDPRSEPLSGGGVR